VFDVMPAQRFCSCKAGGSRRLSKQQAVVPLMTLLSGKAAPAKGAPVTSRHLRAQH
jgi:hypothetical protein